MARISRREFLKISLSAAAGGLLVACGAPTPSGGGSRPEENIPEAVVENNPEPVSGGSSSSSEVIFDDQPRQRDRIWPLEDVPRSRTLVYHYGSPPDGNFAFFGNAYLGNAFSVVVEPCAYYNVLADKQILWLAEGYEYNEDATELTVYFRKDIFWSDGTPFTAYDAAWSIETLRRVSGLTHAENVQKYVDSAESIDDYTLNIRFYQPAWRFFYDSLTFKFDKGDYTVIQPSHYWSNIPDEEINADRFYDLSSGYPISTSAYGVGESTDQYTNYDLRPSWWAVDSGFVEQEPEVWRIQQQRFTNQEQAAQLLKDQEIDLSSEFPLYQVESLLSEVDHVSTWTRRAPPYGNLDYWTISIQFNTQKYPFSDPRVRWAVAYAIDQQQVVDIGWNGAGKVAYSPFPEYPRLDALMSQIQDLTEEYNVLEYDLERSASLMEEAGFYKDSEGFWVDYNGERPDADLYAALQTFGDIAPIVVEQLNMAGFACQLQSPSNVWAAKVDGRASIFLFGHSGGTIDPLDTLQLYNADNAAPEGEQSWSNVTRWDDPEFAAIREEMSQIPINDSRIAELFYEAMKIWYENLPDCPLVQWYNRIPFNKSYWGNWPTEDNPYATTALWHLTAPLVAQGLRSMSFDRDGNNWVCSVGEINRFLQFSDVNSDLTPYLIGIDENRKQELLEKQITDGIKLVSVSADIQFLDPFGNRNYDLYDSDITLILSYKKELDRGLDENSLVPVYTDDNMDEWVPFENYSLNQGQMWFEIKVSSWGDRPCGIGTT